MNLERLLDVLADNERERKTLSELLVWITEDMASGVLTRAHKSASHGMRLKQAVKTEIIGLTLRRSSELEDFLENFIENQKDQGSH